VSGPLQGVRVLELPAIGPVPLLGMLLADLGADVIRVDRIDSDGLFDDLLAGALGRGRRSIGLDLRKPGGAEVALRLAERCDALIEGFRPGVAERLDIGPEAVLARNPRLVYGRLTGWGQDGPLANRAGHDITYLALTGLLHGIGTRQGPPVPPVNYVADFGGGSLLLAAGLLAALVHARETGLGQVIDAAMIDGVSVLGTMTRSLFDAGQWRDERAANLLDGGAPHYRCYACADGKYVAVGALEPRFWQTLLRALGLDPATVPSPYDRDNWDACGAVLTERFATRSRDEWAALLEPLDACVAPVLSLAEAPRHPHHVARGTFVRLADGVTAAAGPRFSATPAAVAPPTARYTDTAALLAEAGFSDAELSELRTAGAIRADG
jgi:alpha-methylacyl-CoA racemase